MEDHITSGGQWKKPEYMAFPPLRIRVPNKNVSKMNICVLALLATAFHLCFSIVLPKEQHSFAL